MKPRRSLRAHLLSSSAWAFSGQIISNIAAVAHLGILSRILEPADMGSYLLVLSIVFFLILLGNVGIPEALVRLIAKEAGDGNHGWAANAVNKSIRITLLSSGALALLMMTPFAANLLSVALKLQVDSLTAALIAVWVMAACYQALLSSTFRAYHDIKNATLFGATAKNLLSVFFVLVFAFTFENFTLELAFLGSALALILNDLIAYILLRPRIKTAKDAPTVAASELLKMSQTFMFNMMLVFIVMRIGLWSLGYFQPKEQVAVFGAALQLVALVTIPLLIINSFTPPLIADMYFNNPDKSRLERMIRTVSSVAAIPSGVMCILFIAMGDRILDIVFGGFYAQGHSVLALLALGQLANIMVGPTGSLLKMTNNQEILLRVNLCFTLFIVTLTVWAASRSNIIGVAGVLGVSLFVQNIVTLYIAKRRTGILSASYLNPVRYFSLYSELSELVKKVRK